MENTRLENRDLLNNKYSVLHNLLAQRFAKSYGNTHLCNPNLKKLCKHFLEVRKLKPRGDWPKFYKNCDCIRNKTCIFDQDTKIHSTLTFSLCFRELAFTYTNQKPSFSIQAAKISLPSFTCITSNTLRAKRWCGSIRAHINIQGTMFWNMEGTTTRTFQIVRCIFHYLWWH